MSEIKVRVNGEDSFDIVLLGLSKRETMSIREAFSAVEVNRTFAQENSGTLLNAARANSVLAELHDEYKKTIRDVQPTAPTEAEEEFVDEYEEEDEFADFSS